MVGMAKKITYGPTRGWRKSAGKTLAVINTTGQLILSQFTSWDVRDEQAQRALEAALDPIDTMEEYEVPGPSAGPRMQLLLNVTQATQNLAQTVQTIQQVASQPGSRLVEVIEEVETAEGLQQQLATDPDWLAAT